MLKRIVKLHFKKKACPEFEAIFNRNKEAIKDFPGCRYLELVKAVDRPIFFTISYWDDQEDLNQYRQSDVFLNTWKKVKPLFKKKAKAWSVEEIYSSDLKDINSI